MKGVLLLLVALTITSLNFEVAAKSKKYKKSGSNVYVSKKYKGHSCPKPRKIINAVYF